MTELKDSFTSTGGDECQHVTPESMIGMLSEFTSTGSKIPWHRDIIEGLHEGRGVPKVSGIFITDVCQHKCFFCSTANRGREHLTLHQIETYVDQLVPLGLKAVILSGGGNPILWRDGERDFNDVVESLHSRGLQIGLITNGMPMKVYDYAHEFTDDPSAISGRICNRCKTQMNDHSENCYEWAKNGRKSWKNVRPDTLDKLTWIRISLSAWDHGEEVQIPDIDPTKTALGASWVYHDKITDPLNRHGGVSTVDHLKTPLLPGEESSRIIYGRDRLPFIKEKMREMLAKYPFRYVRALPDCYSISKIAERCTELEALALDVDPRIVVQYKPPAPHTCCLLGYSHPVLWPSGEVTPCDSVTLLDESDRSQGGSVYVIAKWDTIGELYKKPVQSLIDPMVHCKKCVFGTNNRLLDSIWKGADPQPTGTKPEHVNFIGWALLAWTSISQTIISLV